MDDCVFTNGCAKIMLNNHFLQNITMSSPKLTNRETDNNLRRSSETSSPGSPQKFRAPYCIGGGALEMLIEPVDEDNAYDDRTTKWEYRNVSLNRISGYGFGIAVSGGRDNPHFKNGDPSIVVSDVLKAGPASGLLEINDRIVSANGLSLENADYTTAVQIMKDSDQLNLIVKRRVPLPVMEFEQKTLKFTLTKTKKKDDFGIVLGCRFYVRDITNRKLAEKEPGLKEGDVVLKINDTCCDDMTLTEARKLLDKSRERLSLVVQRDVPRGTSWKWSSQATLYERLGSDTPLQSPTPRQSPMINSNRLNGDNADNESIYSGSSHVRSQRYRYGASSSDYVSSPPKRHSCGSQPPSRSRTPNQGLYDDYGSFSPKNFGPNSATRAATFGDEISRLSSDVQVNTADNALLNKPPLPSPLPEPRFVSFCKEGGSVGVRVIGGNEVGIFVSAVQAGSPAAVKGVRTGDKILRVNERDMRNVTREEAVLHLLGLPDQVDLIVQHKRDEYERVRAQNLGDEFYIRVHFDYDSKPIDKNELSFKKGDIFQVVDTLYGGTVGSWQAVRVSGDKSDDSNGLKGVIPNSSKAEQILANEKSRLSRTNGFAGSSTGSLLRKKMTTLGRRSKSLTKGHWDEVVFSQLTMNFPAYERVKLKHPGFLRPVVIFGPLADVAYEKLLQDFPLRFAQPATDSTEEANSSSSTTNSMIRLSSIREVMNKNKHCLLDVTPSSIEKLQYAQYCPVVVFINVDNRSRLKELRKKHSKACASKNTRKLMEEASKLQKLCKHLFTAVLDATNQQIEWFDALRELIGHLQERRVWMAETRPTDIIDDDFLFPMANNRFSNFSNDSDVDSQKGEQTDYGTLVASNRKGSSQTCSGNGHGTNNIDSEVSSSQTPNSSDYNEYLTQDPSKDSMLSPVNGSYPSNYQQPRNQRHMSEPGFYDVKQILADHANEYGAVSGYPSSPSMPPNSIYSPGRYRTMSSASSGNGGQIYDYGRPLPPPPPLDPASVASLSSPTSNFHPNHPNNVAFYQHQQQIQHQVGSMPTRYYTQLSEPGYSQQMPSRSGYNDENATIYGTRVGTVSRAASNPSASSRSQISHYGSVQRPSNIPAMTNGFVEYGSRAPPYPKPRAPPPAPAPRSPHLYSSRMSLSQATTTMPVNYEDDEDVNIRVDPCSPNSPNPPPYPGPGASANSAPSPGNSFLPHTPLRNSARTPVKMAMNTIRESFSENAAAQENQRLSHEGQTMDHSSHRMAESSSQHNKNNNTNNINDNRSGGGTLGRKPSYQTPATDYNSTNHKNQSMNNNSQIPSPSQSTNSSGLDLANRDKHGGSAFELYKTRSGENADLSPTSRLANLNDTHKVLAHVTAVVGPEGGTLVSESTQVVLKIPPGSLTAKEEVFFKVFQDSRLEPPLDKEKGETLLSPLLMCGPQGLNFQKPVELLLPHNVAGAVESGQWSFVVKTTTTNNVNSQNGSDGSSSASSFTASGVTNGFEWKQIPVSDLHNNKAQGRCTQINEKYASILIEKF